MTRSSHKNKGLRNLGPGEAAWIGAEMMALARILVSDEPLRLALGENGREYVRQNYRWDVVLDKYEGILGKVRNARLRV